GSYGGIRQELAARIKPFQESQIEPTAISLNGRIASLGSISLTTQPRHLGQAPAFAVIARHTVGVFRQDDPIERKTRRVRRGFKVQRKETPRGGEASREASRYPTL